MAIHWLDLTMCIVMWTIVVAVAIAHFGWKRGWRSAHAQRDNSLDLSRRIAEHRAQRESQKQFDSGIGLN